MREKKDSKNEEKIIPNLNIRIIPCNYEQYIAFYVARHLVFLDSVQFMSSSLDKLANNLPEDEFTLTRNLRKKLLLLKRKVFTHMITWIVLISLKERDYPINKIFIAF